MKHRSTKDIKLVISQPQWSRISKTIMRIRLLGLPFLESRVVTHRSRPDKRSKFQCLSYHSPRGFYSTGPSKITRRECAQQIFARSGLELSSEDMDAESLESWMARLDSVLDKRAPIRLATNWSVSCKMIVTNQSTRHDSRSYESK